VQYPYWKIIIIIMYQIIPLNLLYTGYILEKIIHMPFGTALLIQWTLVNPALVNPVLGLTRSKTQGTNHSEPD
jgi:hypothetical protein